MSNATPNLAAEKAELTQISAQIQNGVKAILSGLDVPELQDELDRLRVRKSELEDIIARRSAERPEVDPAAIVRLLQESVDTWDDISICRTLFSGWQQKYTPTSTVLVP